MVFIGVHKTISAKFVNASLLEKIVVLMNATYWGRGCRVMLFKDALSGKNLLKYYIKTKKINCIPKEFSSYKIRRLRYKQSSVMVDEVCFNPDYVFEP